MLYDITIRGTSPILMHNGVTGLDPNNAANIEKATLTRKKGSNRTASDEARIKELETLVSLWRAEDEKTPTIPAGALRSCIETAARKLKQGPQVREGLIVTAVKLFDYDKAKYGTTLDDLGKKTQFTTGVVVQRNRLLRTRAKFDEWTCTFTVDGDVELVDKDQLEAWLDIGGRRIGLGDWRPEKSGNYGRFEVVSVKAAE